MRYLNVATNVAGACAVYVVMAACSGASSTPFIDPVATSPGAGSSSGSGAGGDTDSGSGVAGIDASNVDATADATSDTSTGPVPDANAAETSTSGTRLKAVNYAGTDGSKQFAYWADSMRSNERCAFGIAASDDVMRCLPSGPSAFAVIGTFADSKCTVPAGYVQSACGAAPPAYILSFDQDACGTYAREHVFPAVAFTGPLYYGSPATCNQTSAPVGSTQYKAGGGEIAPASFQQATLVTEP